MKINNLTADQLRKSILQLAIQGKLVKQNSDDEPASELVKKIYAEKQKLIAEGKIKKDKTESYIYKGDDNRYYEKIGKNEPVDITDNLPFDIPDSWEWIRFSNLFNVQTGASFKKDIAIAENKEKYVRVLRGGNVFPFELKFKPDDLFIPNELAKTDILLVKNDLLTPAVTSLENIGKIGVVKEDLYNVTAGGFVYIFRPFFNNSILSNLNMYFISSPIFIQLMKSITKKSGQAFYNMSKERLLNLMIPLPPLAEQQRIVEKIESMEPYLVEYDKIEKQLTKLESEIKDKLKKSILQYAIQGKLVKQDPNDEPASVLLEKIKAEKEKLIKEGKIKRDKNESFIYKGDDKNYYENINGKVINITEEIPFEIPANWCWCRLKSIVEFNLGKTPERDETRNWRQEFPWVSISDMKDKEVIYETKEKISFYALSKKFNNKYSPIGTLLMSFKLTIGRTSLLGLNATHNEAIISIFPFIADNNTIKMFLFNFLGIMVKYCEQTDAIKGVTLNKDKISNMLVPCPSLKNQEKILEKIKILFNNI